MILSRGIKSSLQRELDSYYKEIMGGDFNIRHVTKGAFSQARAKLNPDAFVEMNDNVNQTFYNEAPYLLWHGMRLLASDGTRLMLPNHDSILEEFGQDGFGPNADSMRSLAIGSFLYDVLNLITIDAQIAPYSSSEKDLLYKHLEKVKQGDLLLLDRFYPSKSLFFLLKAKGIEFCVRMKEDWWLPVKEFTESGRKEQIVRFSLPKKDHQSLQDFPEWIDKEIEFRLVRIELENGDIEILCTSLTDTKQYQHNEFKELYHLRWSIEEAYKLFKSRAELENFSGKTAIAVKQDFHAKVFMMSLAAVLAFPIEEKVKEETREENQRKHLQKLNRTQALSMTGNISIGLFIKKKFHHAIKAFDHIVRKTVEIIRPGRKNPRKKHPKRPYHMNYKRL